jgi:hypothetical protein
MQPMLIGINKVKTDSTNQDEIYHSDSTIGPNRKTLFFYHA